MNKIATLGAVKADKHRGLVPSLPDGEEHGLSDVQVKTLCNNKSLMLCGGECQVFQGFLGSAGGQDEPLKFLLRFFKSRPFLHLPLLPVSPSPSYNPIMLYFSELCWVFQTNKVYYTGPTYVVLHTNYSQTHILDFYDVLVL